MGCGMNCKPGDLAIAIKTTFGKNVGKIVTVICADIVLGDPAIWMIECPGVPGPFDGLWLCYDSWLLPVRPGDLHETEDERKEVTA